MNQRFFIIHFLPVENYPPIQNFLHFLNQVESSKKLTVISSRGRLNTLKFNQSVKIYRLGRIRESKLILWLLYIKFNLYTLILLFIKRPTTILYYESISSLSVIVYKKYINRKAKVYIHYHEYTTPKEYEEGSLFQLWVHRLEKRIYSSASWISHTNKVRLAKFLEDQKIDYQNDKHFTLPNYPSKNWPIQNKKWQKGQLLKLIFVGYSAKSDSSYIVELVSWLKKTDLSIELNLFCIESGSIERDLIGEQENLSVNIYPAVEYFKLPKILSEHHVGLILYKGLTENYIYNAPNKLFEYLSCGLDVWYPNVMKGIYKYDSDVSPKVVRLNFKNLIEEVDELVVSENKDSRKIEYFSETIYRSLIEHINLN